MTRERTLEGRTAWVTGGSSGIGFASAAVLESMGATVGVLDVARPSEHRVWVSCDLADRSSVGAAVEELASRTGPADVLVCSAGINAAHAVDGHPKRSGIECSPSTSPARFLLIRACLPHKVAQQWGRIVTLSSGGAVRVLPLRAAYAASKAGLIALAKATAAEVASSGVTANAIAPGLPNTPMAASIYRGLTGAESAVRGSKVANPMGVLLEPADIAAGVGHLCGPGGRAKSSTSTPAA